MIDSFSMVALGDLLVRSEERANIDPEEKYRQVTVKLWGKGVELREEVEGASIAASKMFVVKAQQFILSKIDARNGAFGLIPASLDGAVVSADFPVFTPNASRLLPKFLYWMSKTPDFANLCVAASEGTTNRIRLRIDRFLTSAIPLPPLEEQRRIVARIEQLAAKIEEARELRRKAEEETKVLDRSILARMYDEAIEIAGKTERLNDLCTNITDGTHVTPTYVSEGVPFLSIKDVIRGEINFENARFISPEEHALLTQRCKPEKNDILLTKIGSNTGVAKVIDVDQEFSIFVSLALLKVDKLRLFPKYAEYMLNSPRIEEYVIGGTRGVGYKNLVLKFIREFPMPAPALSEQQRIVSYIDNAQTRIDALKRIQAESSVELDALLPSILDKAFKGEL